MKTRHKENLLVCALVCALTFATGVARGADIAGSVQGAGKPIAGSTVTLFAASTAASTQLAQGKTDDQGAFKLTYSEAPTDSVLYVLAKGGTPKAAAEKKPNDAIALLAVLGGTPPKVIYVPSAASLAASSQAFS